MDDPMLLTGVSISLILLIVLIYFQKNSPNILKVPAQWLAVAALPIIVVLFAGGYITKFSGFGIVLESTLESPISNTIENTPRSIVSSIQGDSKQSVSFLNTLSKQEKLATRYLRFVSNIDRYRHGAVSDYLESLPNLYFLEVVDLDGNFVCLMPIEAFVAGESNNAYDGNQIMYFVESLKNGTVVEDFPQWAITASVKSDTDLISVLKLMRSEKIKYVGVTSANGKYLGVALQSEIEHQIAGSVIAEKQR